MTRVLAWGMASVVLLGTAVLAGGAPQIPAPPARSSAPRDAKLARFQALGEATGADARCRAASPAAGARFFGEAAS